MHRIGHEYNCEDGPRVSLWNNIASPGGIYKRVVYQPLREADKLPDGFGCADDTCSYRYDGEHVWTFEDATAGLRGVLRHRDDHAAVNCYPYSGSLSDDFASHHMDLPGAVTGSLSIGGKTYAVQGLSIRDHGWGRRDWGTLLSHRWIAGTFGPDLSFVALAWHAADDSFASFGWVVKGDTIVFAREVDIIAYTEIDSASVRGGHLRMLLADGDVLDVECTPLAKGLVSYHHDIACVDTMCRISAGGRVGICDFETTANFQKNNRTPGRMINAVVENGFHPV